MIRLISLAVVVAVGCTDEGPGPRRKNITATYVREHILAAEPAGVTRFDLPLGDGAIVYLGNKLDKPRIAPGQAVTVTHYWKVVRPVGARWRVFGLVRGPAFTADFMNLDASDMQLAHGPETWKAGEIIEDVQTFTLRPDWRSVRATLLVGLIEIGRHGTLDRMAATGPRTQERAIIAAELEVDLSRAPPPPGTVHLSRAQGAFTIDGAAADPGWLNSASSSDFATAEGSPDPIGKATARMTWDDQFLYLFVVVTDTDIFSSYTQQDDPLWKADCIEIFVDADGNRRGYVELQVSPNNVTFDSWFAGPRGPVGDEAWDSNMQTAVKVRGTGDKSGDTDQGWDAEIAIPWTAVKGKDEQMAITIPPKIGDRWRLNVVRVDKKTGNDAVSASSWNRITYRDFHALDRMLTVVFADSAGSTTAQPEPAPVDDTGSAAAGSAAVGIAPQAPPAAAGSGSGSGSAGAAAGFGGAGSATLAPRAMGSAGRATGSGGSGANPVRVRAPTGSSGGSASAPPTAGSGSSE